MKYRFFLSAFFIALLPQISSAEYRVFLLKIAKRAPAAVSDTSATASPSTASQDFRLVESTLDPEQYRYYNTVAADEVVTYIDTWRCYGRTGDFAPHCPNPKGQIPSQVPATP